MSGELLGTKVFVYRPAGKADHHLQAADPLQPEVGWVVGDVEPVEGDKHQRVDVAGFTAYGETFALLSVPVQTNYEDENEGACDGGANRDTGYPRRNRPAACLAQKS